MKIVNLRAVKTVVLLSLICAPWVRPQSLAAPVWKSLGPYGGEIKVVAVDPSDPKVVFAGGAKFYRSADGGASWTELPAVPGAVHIVFDPSNASRILVGSGGHVYESLDRGQTWIYRTGYVPIFNWLVVDPASPSTLYAGAGVIWRSLDSGETWSQFLFAEGGGTHNRIVIDPTAPSTMYTSMIIRGVLKTTNGGATWQEMNTGLADLTAIRDLSMDPKDPSLLYLETTQGVYKSANSAASWALAGSSGKSPRMLRIHPLSTSTIYGSNMDKLVYRSQDGGATWQEFDLSALLQIALKDGTFTTSINALALDPATPDTVYCAGGFGPLKTTDGGANWEWIRKDLAPLGIGSLAVDPASSAIYAGTSLGLQRSTDGGATWAQVSAPVYQSLLTQPTKPTTLLALGGDTNLTTVLWMRKSTDGGENWAALGDPSSLNSPRVFNDIVLDPVNFATLYVTGYYAGFRLNSPLLIKSVDSGATWTGIGPADGSFITSLVVDPRTPAILYAGGHTASGYMGQEVYPRFYKSPDGGASWLSTAVPDSKNFVYTLIADPQQMDVVYAGTGGGGIYKTTNGADTWTAVNKGLGNLNILCLAMDPVRSATLYAGTNGGGVFRTTDGGRNWYALNDGLTDLGVKELDIDPRNANVIYASTNSGVFSLQIAAPWMFLSRTNLNFGATTGGIATPSQNVLVVQSGAGSMNWTAAKSQAWISVNPTQGAGGAAFSVAVNAAGLTPGAYTGTVTVGSAEAANSPQTVGVTLTVYADGSTGLPFGDFATPVDGTAGISGAIPVTGWALDDLGVDSVRIYRDPVSGEPAPPGGYVYIGEANFVEGARPDVELAYPAYPQNSAAGWGYMLLTNFLPGNGNGTYRLYAIAADREGHGFLLGSKTITCDNAHAVKPFGTIDTPAQGGSASGADFVNFGWVLTPQPNKVPKDGSTIWIWVDGVRLGHPVYDQFRPDVAANFPGLKNSNGPVGFYHLDTTAFDSGIHTIWWTASDSGGNADGIGARFFTISGTGAAALANRYGANRSDAQKGPDTRSPSVIPHLNRSGV